MGIQALKIFNSRKLILFLILVLGVITVLTACGDFVKESETGACDSAMDARDYETATSVCTDRKDIASAYMGLAGFDIINFLKSSKTKPSVYTEPNALGTDDVAGAFILNILQLGVANIANNTTRATKIADAKENLDIAYSKLQPYLIESEITDGKPPLKTDEILLNSFAISFAMQLDQLILFDNETTSTYSVPRSPHDNLTLTCSDYQVDISDSDAQANLRAMDGHLWSTERNGMQCARVLNAYNAEGVNKTDAAAALATWVQNTASGDNDSQLPPPFYDAVCPSFNSLTNYLTDLAANILKLALPDNNTNTEAITDADNSTNELKRSIGCF